LVWKDDFLKNVCAFANAEGGTLHIGINDKGEITGVDNSKKLVETFPNIINQKLGIVPAIYIENIEEKQVVKIEFQLANNESHVDNGGLNGGLNVGQLKVFNYIQQNQGVNGKEMSAKLNIPIDTMDKYLKVLINNKLIERKVRKKTGGYYCL
jgi:predicted HTH transcriptional regulator